MTKPKHEQDVMHDPELATPPEQTGSDINTGRKGGRSVAGKDLSDSRSSARRGRKSSTTSKKLEREAE